MRTVFPNRELTHVWASQSQTSGSANSMWFQGDTLYSYGEPIARIIPGGRVAVTSRTFSVTTSKHCSLARSATSHLTLIRLRDVVTPPDRQFDKVKLEIEEILRDAAKTRKPKSERLRDKAARVAIDFNEYAKAFGSKRRIDTETITGADLVQLKAKFKKQDDLAKAKRERELAAHLKQFEAQVKDAAAAWRRSGRWDYHLQRLPTMLYLDHKDDVIRTSRNANIPVADAVRLWPVIQRVMRSGVETKLTMDLGHYRLTSISGTGDIVVGCHSIAYGEIERMAKELGLFDIVEPEEQCDAVQG